MRSAPAPPTVTTAVPGADRRRYVRAGAVLWRRTAATVVLLAPGDDDVTELRGTAVALWDALHEPATIAEATGRLAEEFGAAAPVVAADVAAAVHELARRGMVDIVGEG